MTQRVRAHLDMRKLDADGNEWDSDKFVFGNTAGEEITFIKTAWKAACRRAGIVGLHFHDLRREGASCLLEGRVPKHYVKEVLGHANISTTSTYLAGTADGLDDVMARYERERDMREATREIETGVHANLQIAGKLAS